MKSTAKYLGDTFVCHQRSLGLGVSIPIGMVFDPVLFTHPVLFA